MYIHIISLFPEMFNALNYGIPGRAQHKGKLQLNHINLRDFSHDKHRRVDDKPYGGGPGMVIKAQPLQAAIDATLKLSPPKTKVSYLSPQGKTFDQAAAYELSKRSHLILIAGRYEGIDERVYQTHIDEEWSLGDFVLSGGELPIMCMVDAICRLIPEVLGNAASAQQDSFSPDKKAQLLDYPHYTKPAMLGNLAVPDILLSGHHAKIEKWRLQHALGNTWRKRPDLLQNRVLTEQEQVLLAEFISHSKEEN
jgi:tRNA (guanine37-N1)-methyltransferase